MSEHKLCFTWRSPHVTGLCSNMESSQWGWKETHGRGRGKRGKVVMKPESRRRAQSVWTRHPWDQISTANSSANTHPQRASHGLAHASAHLNYACHSLLRLGLSSTEYVNRTTELPILCLTKPLTWK